MDEELRCKLCNIAMPIARSMVFRGISTAAFGALGLKRNGPTWQRVAFLAFGYALGHVMDRTVDSLAEPICGACLGRHPLPR